MNSDRHSLDRMEEIFDEALRRKDADREAYLSLLARADKPAIARIQRASVPRNYFRAFQIAIENAWVHGRTVLTDLQRVDSPDLVAEIADFLLRLSGGTTDVGCGEHVVVLE